MFRYFTDKGLDRVLELTPMGIVTPESYGAAMDQLKEIYERGYYSAGR